MVTKSDKMLHILKKKLLEKIKTLFYFDLNVNRDGMNEGKLPEQSFTSNVTSSKENNR